MKFANFVYFCIIRKLHNFTKFRMLFSAALVNITKVCLKGESSISVLLLLIRLQLNVTGKKQNIPGTVKYVGPVYHSNFKSGIYAGLKLDIPGKQSEDK